MTTLGKAMVEVYADLGKFPRDFREKLKAAVEEGSAGTKFTALESEATKAGERAADNVEKSLSQRLRTKLDSFAKTGNQVANAFMGGIVSIVTNKIFLLTTLISAAVFAVAELGPAALGLLAAVPAALGLIVGALGTVKLAFNGVGDAIKAAFSGDPAKYAEALKKLAPAAREVVGEINAFRPAFHALQQDIQQTFFVQLEGSLRRLLTTLLPTVRTGLHGLAIEFGQVGKAVLTSFSSPGARNDLATIFANSRKAVDPLIPLLGALVRAFLQLAAAAGPFLTTLVEKLARAGVVFADFISRAASNGNLAQFFDTALELLQRFGSLLGNVGSILLSVFDAATTDGASVLGVLQTLVEVLAQFFQTAAGQAVLATLVQLLVALGNVITAVLIPLLPALGGLIQALGPDLVAGLNAAVPLLHGLAVALASIIDFIRDNKTLVEGLGAAFLVLVGAVKTYTATMALVEAATKAWTAAQIALDVAMDANPIGLVVLAIVALIAAIVLLVVYWDDVKKAASAAWDWIKGVGSAIADWWNGVVNAISGFVDSVVSWFESLPGKILAFIESIPERVAAVFQAMIDQAFFVIGFGIGIIIGLWDKLPNMIWDALVGLTHLIGDIFTAAFNFLFVTVPAYVERVVAYFPTLLARIGAWLEGLPGMIRNAFVRAFDWAEAAVINGGARIINFVSSLPGRLSHFFDNVGHDILSGLKSGINGVIGSFNAGINRAAGLLHIGLPNIPYLAKGAIVDSPTLAVLGEGGRREVVLPLEDPARARALADESGLVGILRATSPTPIVNVTAILGTGQLLEVMKVVTTTAMAHEGQELAFGTRAA